MTLSKEGRVIAGIACLWAAYAVLTAGVIKNNVRIDALEDELNVIYEMQNKTIDKEDGQWADVMQALEELKVKINYQDVLIDGLSKTVDQEILNEIIMHTPGRK